jgi:hypothetical protein
MDMLSSAQQGLFGPQDGEQNALAAPLSKDELVEVRRLRKSLAERTCVVAMQLTGPNPRTTFRRHTRLATASARCRNDTGDLIGHTLTTRRLFNVLLLFVQRIYAQLGPEEQQHVLAYGLPELRLSLRDVRRWLDLGSRSPQRVVEAFQHLYELDIRLEGLPQDCDHQGDASLDDARGVAAGESGGAGLSQPRVQVSRSRFRLLQDITLPGDQDQDGASLAEGFVAFRFGAKAIETILAPEDYAKTDLRLILSLSKQASVGLYELCIAAAWRRDRMTAEIDLERLARILSRPQYPTFYDFRRFVLDPSIAELNGNPLVPFEVEMVTVIHRRAVVAVRFRLAYKASSQADAGAADTQDPGSRLSSGEGPGVAGGPVEKATAVLRELCTSTELQSVVDRIRSRLGKGHLPAIRNMESYARRCLEELRAENGRPEVIEGAAADVARGRGRTAGRRPSGVRQQGLQPASSVIPSVGRADASRPAATAPLDQGATEEWHVTLTHALFARADLLDSGLWADFQGDSSLSDFIRERAPNGWRDASRVVRVAFSSWVRQHRPEVVQHLLG